jgi:SsrA-binding protein
MKILNRKAHYDFSIIETYIAGIMLTGSEVKSVKSGEANISDSSFVFLKDGEVFIRNFKISKYKENFSGDLFEENRDKKLLLNKKEIYKIEKLLHDTGVTIVPLEVFPKNGLFKIKIAIAKGKNTVDKRETIKKRDLDRESKRGI